MLGRIIAVFGLAILGFLSVLDEPVKISVQFGAFRITPCADFPHQHDRGDHAGPEADDANRVAFRSRPASKAHTSGEGQSCSTGGQHPCTQRVGGLTCQPRNNQRRFPGTL